MTQVKLSDGWYAEFDIIDGCEVLTDFVEYLSDGTTHRSDPKHMPIFEQQRAYHALELALHLEEV